MPEHKSSPRILVQADGNYSVLFGKTEDELKEIIKSAAWQGNTTLQEVNNLSNFQNNI